MKKLKILFLFLFVPFGLITNGFCFPNEYKLDNDIVVKLKKIDSNLILEVKVTNGEIKQFPTEFQSNTLFSRFGVLKDGSKQYLYFVANGGDSIKKVAWDIEEDKIYTKSESSITGAEKLSDNLLSSPDYFALYIIQSKLRNQVNSDDAIGLFKDGERITINSGVAFPKIKGQWGWHIKANIHVGQYVYHLNYTFGNFKQKKQAGFIDESVQAEQECYKTSEGEVRCEEVYYSEEGHVDTIDLNPNGLDECQTSSIFLDGTATLPNGSSYNFFSGSEWPHSRQNPCQSAIYIRNEDFNNEKTVLKPKIGTSVVDYNNNEACPFVYTYNQSTKSFEKKGTILSNLDTKEKERLLITPIELQGPFDGRILIKEEEPEISYIDYLALKVMDKKKGISILSPKEEHLFLKAVDEIYMIMEKGDQIEFQFDIERFKAIEKISLISKGYYLPLIYPSVEPVAIGNNLHVHFRQVKGQRFLDIYRDGKKIKEFPAAFSLDTLTYDFGTLGVKGKTYLYFRAKDQLWDVKYAWEINSEQLSFSAVNIQTKKATLSSNLQKQPDYALLYVFEYLLDETIPKEPRIRPKTDLIGLFKDGKRITKNNLIRRIEGRIGTHVDAEIEVNGEKFSFHYTFGDKEQRELARFKIMTANDPEKMRHRIKEMILLENSQQSIPEKALVTVKGELRTSSGLIIPFDDEIKMYMMGECESWITFDAISNDMTHLHPLYTDDCACPFIYTKNRESGIFERVTTILTNLDSKEKESVITTEIEPFDGDMIVREEEREKSYIDYVAVKVVYKDNSEKTFLSQQHLLNSIDQKYHVMQTGDEIRLRFDIENPTNIKEMFIISAGYYERL